MAVVVEAGDGHLRRVSGAGGSGEKGHTGCGGRRELGGEQLVVEEARAAFSGLCSGGDGGARFVVI